MMNEIEMSFWEHLDELRKIIIRSLLVIFCGSLIVLYYYPLIFSSLTVLLPKNDLINTPQLLILSPTEGLTTTLKLSFWIGMIGTSPYWLYQVLTFITPGLTRQEKACLIPCVCFAVLFFILGIFFCYYITLPMSNYYLNFFNQQIGINSWSLASYVDYTLVLLLGNGLAFEGISLLFCLVHWGLMPSEKLKKKRRYFIVLAFIVGALLTPPDIMTQFFLAVPLIGCYELAIFYSKLIQIKK